MKIKFVKNDKHVTFFTDHYFKKIGIKIYKKKILLYKKIIYKLICKK